MRGLTKKRPSADETDRGVRLWHPGDFMISLKRYLNRDEDEAVLRQIVSSFFDTIGSTAVVAGVQEHQSFQSEIDGLRKRASLNGEREVLVSAIGAASQTLEKYNQGITRFLGEQGRELQSIVAMMTETIVKIGGVTSRSSQRLSEIGARIESAGSAKDLAAIKANLAECLAHFREETLRQKAEAGKLIDTLQREIEMSRERAAGLDLRDLDPATELPRQEACLKAMQSAADGRSAYAAIIVVNRLQAINARFGHRTGDRILFSFGKFIAARLGPGDTLFRWNGPAVVALLETSESREEVRRRITRILNARIEETFESEARSVLITPAWSVFPLITAISAVEAQIHAFVASQGT
jgi:GGDEF domain-containing protein